MTRASRTCVRGRRIAWASAVAGIVIRAPFSLALARSTSTLRSLRSKAIRAPASQSRRPCGFFPRSLGPALRGRKHAVRSERLESRRHLLGLHRFPSPWARGASQLVPRLASRSSAVQSCCQGDAPRNRHGRTRPDLRGAEPRLLVGGRDAVAGAVSSPLRTTLRGEHRNGPARALAGFGRLDAAKLRPLNGCSSSTFSGPCSCGA